MHKEREYCSLEVKDDLFLSWGLYALFICIFLSCLLRSNKIKKP